MPDDFQRFIETLSVLELGELARDLRQHPEDKEYLHAVLVEVGRRDLTDPTIQWEKAHA